MTSTEPYRHEHGGNGADDDDLIAGDELPDTLVAMLRYVSEEYLPEISAHVAAANEWLAEHPEIEAGTNGLDDPATRGLTGGRGLISGGAATFPWRGIELMTSVMPYRFWLMQRLHDDLASASADDAVTVSAAFADAGLEALFDLRTLRRIERSGHLEVWGPLN